MKEIGIEMTCAMSARRGGVGTYAVELLKSLCTLPSHMLQFQINSLYKLSRFKQAKFRYQSTSQLVNFSSWHGFGLPFKKFDLVHCTDSVFFRSGKSPVIITIHDLAIFKRELYSIPGYTTTEFRESMWKKMKYAVGNCDGIICVSKSTQNDLNELFPSHNKKTRVIYLGVKSQLRTSQSALRTLERPFILFAGLISIRKNILGLLNAFKRSDLSSEYDLVLAGERGMGAEQIDVEIHKLRLGDVVKQTGYLADAELQAYYSSASALAMPTYYEGFGLPAMEAMTLGIPVLVGKYGALPEVTNGFAVSCDPFNTESIANGLKEVLLVPAQKLEEAKKHASTFTWNKCAEETLSFYNAFLKG